ncbi:MAG: DNA mismatch repair protein MutS [Candidatus Rokubacteria bacterium]|nr:DNA mismatch repair protein MutS [Candidatus Rokubacteria bacterium]
MKAHLLHRSRDFDWKWALQAAAEREARRTGRRSYQSQSVDPRSGLPWNAEALTTDLALTTLFNAMARDDDCVFEVSRKVLLAGVTGDLETIRYRQAILQDCLNQPAVTRELYAVAVEAMQKPRGSYLGFLSRYPDTVLRDAIEAMATFLECLKRLRRVADLHAHEFVSEGWTGFFAMLKRDLGDEYFTLLEDHLEELRLRNGELLSAELGQANKGSRYVLHRVPYRRWTWWAWWTGLFEEKPPVYSFELHPRDEAGAQALAALRNRGISLAANALGQSADHVRDFFGMLRAELAFYVGCVNLHEELVRKGEPTCMPVPAVADARRLSCRGLYDVGLALSVDRRVVGNDANADGKDLVIITGPNAGGKSTFLRSVGLAQLMMQSGMFVPAESFSGSLCDGLFTHYKREEDVSMESGKFDEELSRMSDIVDRITSHSMVLFNESFAATNEREGSEIAQQIVSALVENRVRAFYVTHMYELAHGFYERRMGNVLCLRAGRQADGARTFKMMEGEPLPTSFGEDLYKSVFTAEIAHRVTDDPRAPGTASESRQSNHHVACIFIIVLVVPLLRLL